MSVSNALSNDKLTLLYTDQFYVCCYITQKTTNCSAKSTNISDCTDVFASIWFQILIWFCCLSTFSFNLISVAVRLLPSYEKKSIDYHILNINLFDIIQGIYMVIIGTAGLYFQTNIKGSVRTSLYPHRENN